MIGGVHRKCVNGVVTWVDLGGVAIALDYRLGKWKSLERPAPNLDLHELILHELIPSKGIMLIAIIFPRNYLKNQMLWREL